VSCTLTDEVLNCSILLLHKGGETSNKPSDWRPIGLLNVGIQLLHHVINYRLTTMTEAENIIVPGQDGGRARRGSSSNVYYMHGRDVNGGHCVSPGGLQAYSLPQP
jgi:hypothetical protein